MKNDSFNKNPAENIEEFTLAQKICMLFLNGLKPGQKNRILTLVNSAWKNFEQERTKSGPYNSKEEAGRILDPNAKVEIMSDLRNSHLVINNGDWVELINLINQLWGKNDKNNDLSEKKGPKILPVQNEIRVEILRQISPQDSGEKSNELTIMKKNFPLDALIPTKTLDGSVPFGRYLIADEKLKSAIKDLQGQLAAETKFWQKAKPDIHFNIPFSVYDYRNKKELNGNITSNPLSSDIKIKIDDFELTISTDPLTIDCIADKSPVENSPELEDCVYFSGWRKKSVNNSIITSKEKAMLELIDLDFIIQSLESGLKRN